MRQSVLQGNLDSGLVGRLALYGVRFPRRVMIGSILVLALLAFEVFNFDTTRYALRDVLGDVAFAGIGWASVLAIAFCAIDFAGLVRLFTPQKGDEEPREVWFLMGAWLLGATMNALMTWWAVSLTLLNHQFGNEVLSRSQLLHVVPVFVAVLVWLTRILFIGALTVAGEHLLEFGVGERHESARRPAASSRNLIGPGQRQQRPARPVFAEPQPTLVHQEIPELTEDVPTFLNERRASRSRPGLRPVDDDAVAPEPAANPAHSRAQHANGGHDNGRQSTRVRQRPPVPGRTNKNISARPAGRN
jgi:hypothetical protein